MERHRPPPSAHATPPLAPGLLGLLYRYLFFDWLFRDMLRARTPIERHAARQHNRSMRRHLPTYLRRWGLLAAFAFALGFLCERLPAPTAAAWCFTWTGILLTGMSVTTVMWLFLGRPD